MQEQAIAMRLFWAREANAEFDELVRGHGRILFKIAYSVLRNVEDAEDCVQETFLRALRSRKTESVDDARAWLARIAWNVAIDRAKGKRNRGEDAPISEDEFISPAASTEETLMEQQKMKLLQRMIVALPAELREVIVLSTVQELNSPAIADILGIPEGTVRTRQKKARQMLKEKLAPILQGARR